MLEVAPSPGEKLIGTVQVPGFLRHHETGFVNYGRNYVYGDLFSSKGCLRVSYVSDDVPPSPKGLTPVWPVAYELRVRDSVVQVIDGSGEVVASEGDTVRLSGRFARSGTAQVSEWDWVGESVEPCGGPYWVIGDEVSAGADLWLDPELSWVYFPRLVDARGATSHPEALLEGKLIFSDRCLRVASSNLPGQYLIIWPPGFRPVSNTEGVVVVNGGGNVVARVGEMLSVGGYSPDRVDYLGNAECTGRFFYAYVIEPGR